MEDTTAGASSGAGPTPNEPATGPVSGTPSTTRPLLPRIKRDSVINFVNETLDAVELLADRLADVVGLRGKSGPPAPPSAAPEPPPPRAAPPL
jgi:hypothetical protein